MSTCTVSQCLSSHGISRLADDAFQGMVTGALLNMPLVDRVGFGNVSCFQTPPHKTQKN